MKFLKRQYGENEKFDQELETIEIPKIKNIITEMKYAVESF